MSLYFVTVEDVFGIRLDHVLPLSVDCSISYPVIAEPPLLLGAVHDKLICDDEIAVATNPVGDDGIVVLLDVVPDAMFDGELVPTELIADIR